jgi:hypothetical protein
VRNMTINPRTILTYYFSSGFNKCVQSNNVHFNLRLNLMPSPNIANLSYSSIEALPGSSVDWNYTSLPLKFASNQIIAEPRGKVLGCV